MAPASRPPRPDVGETVLLRAGPAELEVALAGATPLRWTLPLLGATWDVLDGYRDGDELRRQDGVRNGIMAPFCNRVADGRYTFDGVDHDLLPGAEERTIYHGLVRTEPFTLVGLRATADRTVAHLRCAALADGRAAGYPYRVLVDVTYTLSPTGLGVAIRGRNTGPTAAPFGSGWHPYFRLPGEPRIDRLHLTIPSTTAIVTDDALLPLTGGAAYRAQAGADWAPIGTAVVDAAFAGLVPAGGTARTTLSDPTTGAVLSLRQDRGLVHVFTGSTLERDPGASIALEPVETMTDAFNRPDCAAALRLEAGTSRVFRFRVSVDQPVP